MTTPDERTRAVLETRALLQALAHHELATVVPRAVSEEAMRLLRHYPAPTDLWIAHHLAPAWYGPPAEGHG